MSAATAQQAAAALQQGLVLHQQGRLNEARTAYQYVLRLEPENVAALNLMGEISVLTNDPTTALDLFTKATRIDPKNALLHVNQGNAYSALNRHGAAVACYEQAIALDPESNVAPYYWRGISLQQLRRHEAAIASYDQAIALGSDLDGPAYYGRATALVELEQYAAALESFDSAIALGTHYYLAEAHYGRGNVLAGLEQREAALASYERAITLKPDYVEALFNRANVLAELKQWEAALAGYERVIAIKPDAAEAISNRGLVLAELKQWEAALASYDRAIAIKPDYAEALFNRGNALAELKRWAAAVASYERATTLKPAYAESFSNCGIALAELKQWEAALASYDRAIAIKPDAAEAISNRGLVLAELKQWEAALASHDRAIAIKPDYAEALSNRGNVLAELKQSEAALSSYDRAIAIKPDYAEALANRGNVLAELQQSEAALASYDRAIAIRPDYAQALASRGHLLGELNQWEAALASYERAIAANPAVRFVRGHRCHLRAHLCDWDGLDTEVAQLTAAIERGEAASEPFPLLALSGSARVQKLAAEVYVRERCRVGTVLPAIRKRGRRDRIRVGYFSADFRNHPVASLTVQLFEEHGRSRFEVVGFSFGPDTQDPMRLRLEKAFDRFIDVRGKSDVDIALLARDMELDIAVDLGGYTQHCRPNIFALRAAPLQVSYVGYLGTMSAPFIDYLVADRTIIPPSHRPYYAEKILYLPSYQANDSKRRIADKVFTRAELGLPQTGFVFCCLNATYKLMPEVFTSWMRVLRAVQGSVLLLLGDIPAAQDNLRKEAQLGGVEPARLIFCDRLPPHEYLARFRAVDLFLDTFPYNAGTTASDALWAGLPVLTRVGESFASRVCASLLMALEMPELITSTPGEYEQLAIALATDPARIAKLRQELAARRLTTALFDIRSFSRHLEAAYRAIHDRYIADLPPEDTQISPST
jgi:protein O-GlcNAc transferase